MPNGKSTGRQRVPARGAATPDGGAPDPSITDRAALDEYLQTLHDTGARLLRQTDHQADPKLSAAIHDAIMEQYNAVLMNLFSRRVS